MWRFLPPQLEVLGMRKLFGGMVLAALALSLPATAMAQRRAAAPAGGAKHEFGVDLGLAYAKPSGGDGGIEIGTPVDVRFGIVSRGELMWEPRLNFQLSSVGGETQYIITPDVNVLYATSPGRHRNGMYFTGGAGLVLIDVGAGPASSGTAFQFNGGIGWRKPYEGAAWRYELGFRWTSESDVTASTIEIGGRIGISLWH
jgi:hypothetical protein